MSVLANYTLLKTPTIYIVSVQFTNPRSVSYNTPFGQVVLSLPVTRLVLLSDGTTVSYPINWLEGSYDPVDPDTYTIQGEIIHPDGIRNPLGVVAEVEITVEAALAPDLLPDQILWTRENNNNTGGEVDNWNNKYNAANDLVKISDARRPTLNATGLDGLPSYLFVYANNDVLRSELGLGLTGSFTLWIIFKPNDPGKAGVGQLLYENTDNGTSFVNTGIQAQVREDEIWVDFRKNDAGDQQRIIFPFDSTDWNVLTVKHFSNGSDSTNVVKLNGALIKKDIGMDAVVHNSNLLKVGANSINTNGRYDGSEGELNIIGSYMDAVTESGIMEYIKTRYPNELGNVTFFDEDSYRPIDALNEAWNGLALYLRPDNKYDLIAGTLTGKIYYFQQGATVNDWTAFLLVDTLREIQSVKIFGLDSSGRLVIISAHKDSAAPNDNVGKLVVSRANTVDPTGAYTSANLVTNRPYPQDILVADLDGDSVDEFMFSFEGTSSANGGYHWFKCNDLSDVLNPAAWTENVARLHPGAWWIAGVINIGGIDRILVSARNNTTRNPDCIPGVYYITPASPVTNPWSETTIDNAVLDFNHVDFGNVYGNSNDIVSQNHDNTEVYAYDAANSFAKATLFTGNGLIGTNLKTINQLINGRSAFLFFQEDSWAVLAYSVDGTDNYIFRNLFQTLGHPADNQIYHVDLDDSGFLTVVFDDNTNLMNSHVYKFQL